MKLLNSKISLLEHFQELMHSLRRIIVYLLFACGLCYFYSSELLNFLWAAVLNISENQELIYTRPFEKVWILMRLSLFAGAALVSPLIFLELFLFFKPALKKNEKTSLYSFSIVFALVFIAGILLGYVYVLPLLLQSLFRFGADAQITALFTVSAYVNTVVGVLLFSALFFEIPVLMFFLTKMHLVSVETWRKSRRLAFVVNAFLAALLSPPDPLSMLVMLLPLQLLYELGLLSVALIKSKSVRQTQG